MKRKTKNIIEKPNYSGINREIHGVLRDFDSNMVFSEIENGKVFYRQTNIKDLPIKPNNLDGRRGFHSGVWLKVLKNNVVNSNYIGPLFMYDIHLPIQNLIPIDEYTINRNIKQPHRVKKDGIPIQPYCKESKKLYQNAPGNKLRTKNQLFEGSVGSRTRALTTALFYNEECPTINEVFNKFDKKCFCCGESLDINVRKSYQIDHFMPACGYWPLNHETATLLCFRCNQKKKDHHPLKFYGIDNYKKIVGILNFNILLLPKNDYILNDKVLFFWESNFEKIMEKWGNINRNKKSFKKYVESETNRIIRLDTYQKHTYLIEKLKEYGKKI